MCLVNSQEPRVNSKLGVIIGKTTTIPIDILPYRNVDEYLGIPFAEPPMGERRFRKPDPKKFLDSPFYAQNHSAICPQITAFQEAKNVKQNEDCLFLNVYVPEQPADQPSGHAVMVWVYGGGFQEGASNFYNGAFMAAAGNIIVVTINYRVGAFGFLSTGDENAPGNFGLWDQKLAFEWVSDYIADFGGDNQRITIAGESAGAMSTMQHALTPDNHGHFQRVIAQSGSMSMPGFDSERDGMKDTLKLAIRLGCPTSMDELMPCLRSRSVDDHLSALGSFGMEVNFGPIMDDDFMKVNPQHISKMSEYRHLEEVDFFRSLDVLTGFNAYEGAFMLPFIIDSSQIEDIQPTREEMSELYLPLLLRMVYRKEFSSELIKLIELQYTNWSNPDSFESIRLQIAKLGGDINFAVPAVDMARLHKLSSAASNYMYFFTPKPSVRTIQTPSWIPGANHADELLFMFGGIGTLGVGDENAWEIELITKMMTYWTNFVKSGDPNSPEPMTPFWPGFTVNSGEHIVLERDMSNASAKRHLYAEEFNFWMSVFPALSEAVEDKGTDSSCEEITNAAANLNISNAVVLVLMTVLSLISVF